jgi:DNA-binding NarL/FixJ family response regulator
MTIRLVVVDDQAMVRAGLAFLCEREVDIEVVAEAADGRAAISAAVAHRPDVVLMDIRMPVMDGLSAARSIRDRLPDTKVLLLTTFDDDELLFEGLQAGVSGFLLKVAPPEQLLAAIRTVADGGGLLDPAVTRRVMEAAARDQRLGDSSGRLSRLTPRELDVLALIGRGLSNREIADELILSEATVKTHVSRILAKLGLRDRVQAVVLAYECGLVRPQG